MSIFSSFRAFRSSTEDEDPPYYAPLEAGDYAAALPLLEAAMCREDAHAMGVMAAMLAMGRGVDQDPQEACAWFRQAANRGDLFSQTAFGMCLATGFGTARDATEAAYWLYRAGRAGHHSAVDILSDLALQHQAVIGVHFTMGELVALVRAAKLGGGAKPH
jgi:TPR repeat protein